MYLSMSHGIIVYYKNEITYILFVVFCCFYLLFLLFIYLFMICGTSTWLMRCRFANPLGFFLIELFAIPI